MSLLTAQDFDNVFKFYTELNHCQTNLEAATLRLLSDCFGISLSSYAIFDRDPDGNRYCKSIVSDVIRAEDLNAYRCNGYRKDIFFNYINRLRYTADSRYVYTSADLGEAFESSEYRKLLLRSDIGCQAILGGNGDTHMPTHILTVYKSVQAGAFTERELELFPYIGKAFSECVGLYKARQRQTHALDVIQFFADIATDHGFAILTPKGQILSYNTRFITYSSMLSKCSNLDDVANELLSSAVQKCGAEALSLSGGAHYESHGYDVMTLQKKLAFGGDLLTYTLLSLRPGDAGNTPHAAVRKAQALTSGFGLTDREAQVLELILDGTSNNEIAETLYISMYTVKSHIHNIFAKCNVSTRSELIRLLRAPQG